MSLFVIGYDITEPKRLQRVYRVMLRHATAIEYSIFLLSGTELAAKKCMQEVLKIIKFNEDDIRCYPLPCRGLQARMVSLLYLLVLSGQAYRPEYDEI